MTDFEGKYRRELKVLREKFEQASVNEKADFRVRRSEWLAICVVMEALWVDIDMIEYKQERQKSNLRPFYAACALVLFSILLYVLHTNAIAIVVFICALITLVKEKRREIKYRDELSRIVDVARYYFFRWLAVGATRDSFMDHKTYFQSSARLKADEWKNPEPEGTRANREILQEHFQLLEVRTLLSILRSCTSSELDR